MEISEEVHMANRILTLRVGIDLSEVPTNDTTGWSRLERLFSYHEVELDIFHREGWPECSILDTSTPIGDHLHWKGVVDL